MKIRSIVGKILLAGVLMTSVLAGTSALAGGKHAALAYSESQHRYGWSTDKGSKEEAEESAVKACGSESCRVRLTFTSSCGAFAEGSKNIHYGWARGSSLGEAEKAALQECKGHGGNDCTIRVQACN